MLVFSTYLEEIEEIGSGGMNCNQVFGGGGLRVGDGRDDELMWTLQVQPAAVRLRK